MGSYKKLIHEYIDTFFPECSQQFFEELQSMIMDCENPQFEAFLQWCEFDYTPMMKDGKRINTEERYAEELKKKPRNEVSYVMNDAKNAYEAMPDGKNAGYYMAEVRLCDAELKRRDEEEEEQWKQACQAERDMMGG